VGKFDKLYKAVNAFAAQVRRMAGVDGEALLQALKVGYLAFDATRTSATDVGFPLDIVVYHKDSYRMTQYRFMEEDFREISIWWNDWIRRGLTEIPTIWFDSLFSKLDAGDNTSSFSK
jgi:putative proteasome-type protease